MCLTCAFFKSNMIQLVENIILNIIYYHIFKTNKIKLMVHYLIAGTHYHCTCKLNIYIELIKFRQRSFFSNELCYDSIGGWPQHWKRCFSSRQMIKHQFISPGMIIRNVAAYIVYLFLVASYRRFIPTHLIVGNVFRH
jgi:hypothetical protein